VVVLESLGCVETVSGEGRFVVKAVTVPEMNETVYTRDGKKLGTVKRIFGPVEGPYVTVDADNGTVPADIIGKKVFTKGEIKNAKGKRRH
jgi:RNA-binding protein